MSQRYDEDEIRAAYRALAAFYAQKRSQPGNVNDVLEQPALAALLPDLRGACLLDAGCGTGLYARWLAEQGAAVTGIDLSPDMVQRAREHCAGLPVRLDVGSILALPYADASFDGALACYVLHYVPDQRAVLAELARVLRPGGFLLLSLENPAFSARVELREHAGRPAMVISDYFRTGKTYFRFRGHDLDVPSFHVPLPDVIEGLAAAGLQIDRCVEPRLQEQDRARLPPDKQALIDLPTIFVLRARKLRSA